MIFLPVFINVELPVTNLYMPLRSYIILYYNNGVGPPVSELYKSQNSFLQCRDELITLISSNDDLSVALSFVFHH